MWLYTGMDASINAISFNFIKWFRTADAYSDNDNLVTLAIKIYPL